MLGKLRLMQKKKKKRFSHKETGTVIRVTATFAHLPAGEEKAITLTIFLRRLNCFVFQKVIKRKKSKN